MLRSSVPFFSKEQSVSLELPDDFLLMEFDGSRLELKLGKSPPRFVFFTRFVRVDPYWEEGAEFRFAGVTARIWRHKDGQIPLNYFLFHYKSVTVEVRFALLQTGLAGSYQIHESLKPLSRMSLGFQR